MLATCYSYYYCVINNSCNSNNHEQLCTETNLTRQKLNDSLKQKLVDYMFTEPFKILNSELVKMTLKI